MSCLLAGCSLWQRCSRLVCWLKLWVWCDVCAVRVSDALLVPSRPLLFTKYIYTCTYNPHNAQVVMPARGGRCLERGVQGSGQVGRRMTGFCHIVAAAAAQYGGQRPRWCGVLADPTSAAANHSSRMYAVPGCLAGIGTGCQQLPALAVITNHSHTQLFTQSKLQTQNAQTHSQAGAVLVAWSVRSGVDMAATGLSAGAWASHVTTAVLGAPAGVWGFKGHMGCLQGFAGMWRGRFWRP